MNRRAIGITLIVLAGVLLLFIIYIIFFKNFSQTPVSSVQSTVQEVKTEAQMPKITSENIPEKVIPVKPPTKEELSQDELKRLAMLFAARFGSFSNHSTYQNITDLKMFMTDNMQTWADKYVAEQNSKDSGSAIYYGITTTAATADVKSFDTENGRAEIHVGTQRREATGVTNNASNYGQILKMKFVREAGSWRIDEARWDEKKMR